VNVLEPRRMDIRRAGDRGNDIPYLKLSSILCKNKREMRKETGIFVPLDAVISCEESDSWNLTFEVH